MTPMCQTWKKCTWWIWFTWTSMEKSHSEISYLSPSSNDSVCIRAETESLCFSVNVMCFKCILCLSSLSGVKWCRSCLHQCINYKTLIDEHRLFIVFCICPAVRFLYSDCTNNCTVLYINDAFFLWIYKKIQLKRLSERHVLYFILYSCVFIITPFLNRTSDYTYTLTLIVT